MATPDEIEAIFIARLINVLQGLWIWSDWYMCSSMKVFLSSKLQELDYAGLAEVLSVYFSFEIKTLLSADAPPGICDFLRLTAFGTTDFAVYVFIVLFGDIVELYVGSGIDTTRGYHSRRVIYTNFKERTSNSTLPEFLAKHLRAKDHIYTFGPYPLATLQRDTSNGQQLQDHSIWAKLLESTQMVWLRSLLPGGGFEKIMKFSPWNAVDMSTLRKNRGLSVREWPKIAELPSDEAAKSTKMAHERKNTADRERYHKKKALELGIEYQPRPKRVKMSAEEKAMRKKESKAMRKKESTGKKETTGKIGERRKRVNIVWWDESKLVKFPPRDSTEEPRQKF